MDMEVRHQLAFENKWANKPRESKKDMSSSFDGSMDALGPPGPASSVRSCRTLGKKLRLQSKVRFAKIGNLEYMYRVRGHRP